MNTVAKETYAEFEVKKSRFIAYIKPVSTKEEASVFITEIQARHSDATHNVYAYRLIENKQEYFKYSDDGEPKDTAGKPVAEIMNYNDLYNLVIVVTRYFGGVKLGAGGLIRNYGKAGKLAIDEAGIIELIERKNIIIDFDYSKISEVDRLLEDHSNEVTDKIFEVRVTYRLSASDSLIASLQSIPGIILIE